MSAYKTRREGLHTSVCAVNLLLSYDWEYSQELSCVTSAVHVRWSDTYVKYGLVSLGLSRFEIPAVRMLSFANAWAGDCLSCGLVWSCLVWKCALKQMHICFFNKKKLFILTLCFFLVIPQMVFMITEFFRPLEALRNYAIRQKMGIVKLSQPYGRRKNCFLCRNF